MTNREHAPLLRIPPFPGARHDPIAVPAQANGASFSDQDVDRLIAEMRRARIGGSYWAMQPDLPPSYVLVRRGPGMQRPILPGATIVEWVDADAGTKELRSEHFVVGPCDPWHMVRGASLVVAEADDELLLIAAIEGVPVRSVGRGRFSALDSDGAASAALSSLFRSEVGSAFTYCDPFTGNAIGLEQAIALCAFWRTLIDGNREVLCAIGFAAWKQKTVAGLLWNGSQPVQFRSRPKAGVAGRLAVWKSRTSAAVLEDIERSSSEVIEVEDGFIRSAGLGADCIPPLSIVADRTGIYFDPSRPSDLESLLQCGGFDQALIERARELRALIVERGVSKYATGATTAARRDIKHRQILVPGQVEDDRAVLCGLGPTSNLELLARVRAEAPDAYIIYKPHPDVEAGHRVGHIDDNTCLEFADEILRGQSIASVIAMVDEVHVNSSLAGFEALLREKRVVTYGVPFYAGWGLTVDRGPVPSRRSTRRTLDELVAASLLVYPRYLDPVTSLPCPAETLITRLSESVPTAETMLVRLRRAQGALRRRFANVVGWRK